METSKQYIVAEIELVYKAPEQFQSRPTVSNSRDAYSLLLEDWDKDRIGFIEQFKILLLNRTGRVIAIYNISTGGTTSTVVDPKLVMVAALKANTSSIILAHNHPSGNLKPSHSDDVLTRKLRLAGELLDIKVADHLIMTADGFLSFSDEGLL